MTTREQNIKTYMSDWRGGYWCLRTTGGIADKVADEVVAYTGLEDSTANLSAYRLVAALMIANGKLKVTYHDSESVTIELP